MQMKKILISVSVLAVVAGGGLVLGQKMLERSAEQSMALLRASLPPGVMLTYDKPQTSLLHREVRINNISAKAAPMGGVAGRQLSVQDFTLRGVPWLTGQNLSFSELDMSGLRIEGMDGYSLDHIHITRPGFNPAGIHTPRDISFSALSFEGLSATRTSDGAVIKVPAAKLGQLVEGILASGVIEGYESHGPGQDMKPTTTRLAKLEVQKADLNRLVGPQGTINYMAALSSTAVEGITATGLSIGDAEGPGIELAALQLGGAGTPEGARTALSVQLQGFTVYPKAMSASEQQYYRNLGYETLSANVQMKVAFSPEEKTFSVEQFTADANNMGHVELSVSLGNVPDMAKLAENPQSARFILPMVTFRGLDVKIRDQGFLKRQIAYGADQMQVEPQVYVEQVIGALRPADGATGPGAVRLGQLYRAVSTFLLGPGELTIAAKPQNPVPLMQFLVGMHGLPAIAEAVNLSAQHRQINP